MNKIITTFLRKYKYMILVLYFPIYMLWFSWLERRDLSHFTIIHCKLDDMIPFCELFAIPYFLWFLYVAVSLLFLFLQSEHMSDFYRCSAVLMLGMTTCLIIYTIFPNAQPLRPESFPARQFSDRDRCRLVSGRHSDERLPEHSRVQLHCDPHGTVTEPRTAGTQGHPHRFACAVHPDLPVHHVLKAAFDH